jgi:hypothetical protein
LEDKRLEKILNWAEMPYRSLPLELPKKVQEMVDAKKIKVSGKTVLDMYCLSVLAEKMQKGDISLLEQLVGKAGIRQPKEKSDDLKDLIPNQANIMKKYNRIN